MRSSRQTRRFRPFRPEWLEGRALLSVTILDDADPGFTVAGPWVHYDEADRQGRGGALHYAAAGDGAAVASWTVAGLEPGFYRIATTWTPHPNRATDAPFAVFDGSQPLGTVRLDQEQYPVSFSDAGNYWEDLGVFSLAGGELTVRLSNAANEYVIADALRIEAVDPPTVAPVQVVDDGGVGFSRSGPWVLYDTDAAGRQGVGDDVHYAAAGTGPATATWEFVVDPGVYRVAASWSPHPNRATDAPFTVLDEDTPLGTVRVDQEQAPGGFTAEGVPWADLGTFDVNGDELLVRLSNEANEYVIADAVRIERVGDLPPPNQQEPGERGIDPFPTPLRVVPVSTRAELDAALAAAQPGDELRLAPGFYGGDVYARDLAGTAEHPIVIAGADPLQRPEIGSAGEGIHLESPQYVVLRHLLIKGNSSNGLNIDDTGLFDQSAHHITVHGVTVRLTDLDGQQNAVKFSGVRNFRITESEIIDWGNFGAGFDGVGVQDGLIEHTLFADSEGDAGESLVVKGGSQRVEIRNNRFSHGGRRGINVGGQSNPGFFRPAEADGVWEARDIDIHHNLFEGIESPVALASSREGVRIFNNTFVNPQQWLIRVLQENPDIAPLGAEVHHNLVVFAQPPGWPAIQLGFFVPVTVFPPGSIHDNAWFNRADATASVPTLPVAEANGIYGLDPLFVDPAGGDYRPGNPALAGYGAF